MLPAHISPWLPVWTAFGALALWIGIGNAFTNFYDGVMLLSILNLALGISIFWAGRGIAATNIYGFAFALFVGFAGIYTLTSYSQGIYIPYLLEATAFAYFGQVFIYCTWWYIPRRVAKRVTPPRSATTAQRVTRWGVTTGAVIFAIALAGALGTGQDFFSQVAFAGGVLMCTAMFIRPKRGIGLWRVVVAASTLIILARLVFNGFGRLELGAFGLALAIAASAQFGGKAVKFAILIASAPVVLYLAQQREAFVAGLDPNQVVGIDAGFGSIVSPLSEFAGILGLHSTGQMKMHYFETLFASVAFWVPRGLWSGKPVGFGATLADIFHPELHGTGFSDAALFQSEWVYSFGIPGLVLMVPVVGIGVRWLDSRVGPIWERGIATTADLLKVALATIVIAGLPDLVWAGTFTFVSRAGERASILVALLILASARQRDRSSSPQSSSAVETVRLAPKPP